MKKLTRWEDVRDKLLPEVVRRADEIFKEEHRRYVLSNLEVLIKSALQSAYLDGVHDRETLGDEIEDSQWEIYAEEATEEELNRVLDVINELEK